MTVSNGHKDFAPKKNERGQPFSSALEGRALSPKAPQSTNGACGETAPCLKRRVASKHSEGGGHENQYFQ
jgi:hypothetical protein